MDEKENKMGLKRKCIPMEASFDSGDDEPIGSLMKLKGKKRSKKIKVVPDESERKVKSVEKIGIEDEELGGMEDTLANFRKKLRGPKRNSGAKVGKDSSNNLFEQLCQSTREYAKDGRLDIDKIFEVQPKGSVSGGSPGDATVFNALKMKAKRNSKRREPSLDAKTVARDPECDGVDYWIRKNCSPRDGKEDTSEQGDEAVENSLSSLFQEVQTDMTWKSCNSSMLEQVKETEVFDDESIAGSEAPPVKSRSTLKLVKNLPVSLNRGHVVHGQGSINSTLIHQTVDGCLPEDLNGAQRNLVCSDSKQELSSYSSVTDHLSGFNNMDNTSFKVLLENSSLVEGSHSMLRGCSGKICNVQDGDINSETSGTFQVLTLSPPVLTILMIEVVVFFLWNLRTITCLHLMESLWIKGIHISVILQLSCLKLGI